MFKKYNMKNIILGVGEVGKAILSLYKENKIKVVGKDINDHKTYKNVNFLNICIPYNDDFLETVVNEIEKLKPKITIIHSTVPIGTTQKLKKITNAKLAHSPVVGSHPFLKKSLKTFTKYVSANDKKTFLKIKKHFKLLKIKSKYAESFTNTETAKLLCTSYYGVCIAWHYYMNEICKKHNVDFSFIQDWNKNYNDGYSKNKLSKYNRPILYPPESKKIGGHCVIPNADILKKTNLNPFIENILSFK